jgi:hypothetical protein
MAEITATLVYGLAVGLPLWCYGVSIRSVISINIPSVHLDTSSMKSPDEYLQIPNTEWMRQV